ncbi:MAG: arginyltransferase [Spirochaetales bacterium]|nr:arginyltransferase [Spirochaetales bacterium]
MLVYLEPTISENSECPYINTEKYKQRYAVLKDLDTVEFDFMLHNGWRHFGYYFFMPNCDNCNKCIPIRTLVNDFTPTKSQKRNLKKNDSVIEVSFEKPEFTKEIYEIYSKHSLIKFNQKTEEKDFIESFFSDALKGNSLLSLYRIENKLVGVGFLDISETGLSSVYFCYDPQYSKMGLGVYSVLKEIEYSKNMGKDYYYLGYYVKGNQSMEYKASYTPSEILDWDKAQWVPFISDHTV